MTIVLALLLSAAPQRCDGSKVEAALLAFDLKKGSWSEFRKLYERYGACFDGASGEEWDESIAQMLLQHWSSALKYPQLLKDTPFRRWLVQHLDGTQSLDDLRTIAALASQQNGLTAQQKRLCELIRRALMPR